LGEHSLRVNVTSHIKLNKILMLFAVLLFNVYLYVNIDFKMTSTLCLILCGFHWQHYCWWLCFCSVCIVCVFVYKMSEKAGMRL